MQEVRCEKCNKLLYKLHDDHYNLFKRNPGYVDEEARLKLDSGIIECKCPRCGEINKTHKNIQLKLNASKESVK